MNILKILFGKKVETESQPNMSNNESNAQEPCNDDNSKDGAKKSVADGNKSETTRDDIQNVYHLIVVDESGSMSCIRKQTVDGCNETISHIKMLQEKSKGIQKHYLSLFFFYGGNMRYIRNLQPIEEVDLITEKDYTPCSNTPLYDAMGDTLNDLGYIMKKDSGYPLGYVTVITDGYENSSHRFTLQDIYRIVGRMKENGVVFSFIGANIDVDKVANDLNIGNATSFNQTDEGTRSMWSNEMLSKERYIAKSLYFDLCKSTGFDDSFISEKEWRRRENAGDLTSRNKISRSRITPDYVSELKENEIFVFGSNILGHHNGSAAGMAVKMFGATYGKAEGLQGRSYAIPTDYISEHADIHEIFKSVVRFTEFARQHPELTFLVTALGTGNAGIDPMQMASMFFGASKLPNVKLPKVFWKYL